MRINILFVLQDFGIAGSERVVLDLCKGLDKQIFNASVVSLYGGSLKKEFKNNGINAVCLNKGGGIDVIVSKKIRNFILKNRIHIVNAHHFSPYVHTFLASVLTRCKIIYTDHTVREIENLGLLWGLVGTLFLKFSNGVIGISHDVTKELMRKFKVKSNKAFTILNAVDSDRFKVNADIEKKRTELGLKQNDKVIGIVGNLREQKNHSNLISAFSIVRRKIPNSKLVIVGEGVKEKELRNQVEELGIKENVIFLGSRLDVPEIYYTFNVYCLCSHYEGLPLTILEAMCCKIPVVGTEVDGIKDVIIHDHNGILVPPDNYERLAEALIELLKNKSLVKRLSRSAYKYVLKNHDRRVWLKKYEDLFKNMHSS